MRLGPILQAIVAVPQLAAARDWAVAELGLGVTATGHFPRAVALTLGDVALAEQPCLTLGTDDAPALLLLIEDSTAGDFPELPLRGWSGLRLRRPGPERDCVGLGITWTLVEGPAALTAVTLCTPEPDLARGYYQGIGARAPLASAPWTLPLHEGALQLQRLPAASIGAATSPRPAGLRALVSSRGSPAAVLRAPCGHGEGRDGEWLLLRDQPILPVVTH